MARVAEHGRGDRRRRLAPPVAVVEQPGGQANGRVCQSIQRCGRVPIMMAQARRFVYKVVSCS
jgi:hypothetical protein